MSGKRIGAILAVPLTMMVLIILGNFEGTQAMTMLMRYTGKDKQEEMQAVE
jgi:hypothetical protein